MTAVLRETTCVDQTLSYAPPTFQARAILAYGHDASSYGKTFGSGQFGSAGWGFQTETDGVWEAASFGITGAGSLETGSSGFEGPGGQFFSGNGGGTPTGTLNNPTFNCGELDFTANLDTSTYCGLILMGGNTLETACGAQQFSGTGTVAITGVGFQPDLILMSGSGHGFTGGGGANPGPVNGSFGAADANLNQFAVAAGSSWNTGTAGRIGRTVNDGCFLQVKANVVKCELLSMDSDGFTIDVTGTPSSEYFFWVAIRDPNGNFAVGTMTEGDASIAPGFTPEALFFASAGNSSYGSSEGGCGLAYGGASSDGTNSSGWQSAANGNVLSARYWSNTTALSWIKHPTGGGVVSEAEAVVASWGSTTNLTWTTGPGANTIRGGWVAMQTSEGAGYNGCGVTWIPQIYRRR